MDTYETKVYISYAWGGESEEFANKIDHSLQQRGITIIRDKRALGFKGSIQKFMEEIGKGNSVIVIVSDKYLRSPNCMFELVEIAKNKQVRDRIFPIVLSDANIYDPIKRIEYVKYWEDKRQELASAIKSLDPANLQGIREDMDNYDRFRAEISGLASTLKDINTLNPKIHQDSNFSELYAKIEERRRGIHISENTSPSSDSETDEVLHKLLSGLPTALFERIIFKFDKSGIVPGPEAAQSKRAIELIKFLHIQENGIAKLNDEIEKFTGDHK